MAMCWKDPAECYNGGGAFKLVCRTMDGVMVTVIADNYFGYCKKEVKTQISMAANFFGLCEEEHAGGALGVPALQLRRGPRRDASRGGACILKGTTSPKSRANYAEASSM